MKKQILNAAKTVGIISAICLIISLLYWMFEAFNFGALGYILFYNPFVSALVHSDFSHLTNNMLMLFLCLIPVINQEYKILQIVIVSSMLSFIYFPLLIFQVSLPVIGLSMFAYFLLGRIVFSRKKYFWIVVIPFFILLLGEATIITTDYSTAHLAHIIGALLGSISIRFFPRLLGSIKTQ